jgi:hypothetical protein
MLGTVYPKEIPLRVQGGQKRGGADTSVNSLTKGQSLEICWTHKRKLFPEKEEGKIFLMPA